MEVDLSQLDAATRTRVDEIFRTDFDLKALKAIEEQKRTAKRLENGVMWKDDFGPQLHAINPFFDWMWRVVYGHNYTEDPDVMKFLSRRNEEINVRARSGKTMVGYQAPARRAKTGCTFGRGTIQFAT